jgi:hypothetical protein
MERCITILKRKNLLLTGFVEILILITNITLAYLSVGRCNTCNGTKKHCWIWIAVDRNGKNFLDCTFGNRGTKTGQKLWDKLK